MLPKLSKSQRFLDEIKMFKLKADLLSNEDIKNSVYKKIFELKKLAENIDIAHDTSLSGMIRPTLMDDTKREMTQLRRSIKQLLESA